MGHPDAEEPLLRRRAHLGIEVLPAPGGVGLEIASVLPDGFGSHAGLAPGDRLIALDGARVRDARALLELTRTLVAGETLFAVVERHGVRRELHAPVLPLPVETLPEGRVVLGEVGPKGARLRTVFTVPEGPGPHPVVYFLPGASFRSFEFPFEPENPTFALLRGLTRAGFVTLRVERSGVGDSEGPPCKELGLEEELDGYRSGFDALGHAAFADGSRVFGLGHSLGGMELPLLAAPGEASPFRALAVFGTTARSWHVAALAAARRSLELHGYEGARLDDALAGLERLQQRVYENGETPEEAFMAEPDLRDHALGAYEGRYAFGRTIRFFQELQKAGVEAGFRAVRPDVPVLALHGEHDWVTTLDDARHLASLVPNGRFLSLPGVDHQMRASESLRWSFEHPAGGPFGEALLQALVQFFRAVSSDTHLALHARTGFAGSGHTEP